MSMPVHLLKPILIPLLILVVVNLAAIAWRAIPQQNTHDPQDNTWEALEPSAHRPDVRRSLLAGGHWGQPDDKTVAQDGKRGDSGEADSTPEATARALGKHIQRQLQGIIRRGEWVLLFAQPDTDTDTDTDTDGTENTLPLLPLELRSGDMLPDTPWLIGQIWADRIQLLQDEHDPLIVPLYPIAESVTEP